MNTQEVAGAEDVRDEDAFDVPAVDSWLRASMAAAGNLEPPAGRPRVKQFSGGASNLTYLLRYDDRDLILRRPPAGVKAAGAHDMGREYRFQQRLKPVFGFVPTMVAFCDDPTVTGSDFYVMERLDGVIPRRDFPAELRLDPAGNRRLAFAVVDLLVDLHRVDPAEAGLADLGKGFGYVRRQVDGWSNRFRRARTDNVPTFEKVMAWLDGNAPDDVRNCVVHNDFRFDNVVFDAAPPHDTVGVLDWEMATLGDPLMDLGGALAYWVQADDDEIYQSVRRQPTNAPGMPTRREVVDHYCAAAGLSPDGWTFYEVFGLFRLAVIVQQIYYRYFHGQTTNPRFADYWIMATYLESRCQKILDATG